MRKTAYTHTQIDSSVYFEMKPENVSFTEDSIGNSNWLNFN